jgi:hypothetical protein
LGQSYTDLGLCLAGAALGLHAIEALYKNHLRVSKVGIAVAVCGAVLWAYLLTHALLVQSEGADFVIKAAISNLTVIFVFALLLSDPMVNRLFFRTFVALLAAFGASAMVTMALFVFVPLSSLYIGHIDVEGYAQQRAMGAVFFQGVGDIYFPFSMGYGIYPVGDAELPRFAGFFREAGILQAFMLWSVVYVLNERLPRLLLIPLLFGIFTTFSSIGVALLPGTLLAWAIYRMRIGVAAKSLLAVVAIGAMLLASFYAPMVGLSSKNEVRETSLTDRSEASGAGFSSALEDPLGGGLYSEIDVENSGINLVALTGQIGFVGFLLAVLVYAAPLAIRNQNRAAYAVAVFPVLMTSLLSQPLLDAPLIYVLLLARFAKNPARSPLLSSPPTSHRSLFEVDSTKLSGMRPTRSHS